MKIAIVLPVNAMNVAQPYVVIICTVLVSVIPVIYRNDKTIVINGFIDPSRDDISREKLYFI